MRVHHVRDLGTRPNPTQMTAQMPAQNTPHKVGYIVLATRPNYTNPAQIADAPAKLAAPPAELAVMRPNPLEGVRSGRTCSHVVTQ